MRQDEGVINMQFKIDIQTYHLTQIYKLSDKLPILLIVKDREKSKCYLKKQLNKEY